MAAPTVDLSALAAGAVTYPSDGRTLAGYLFVPEGEGPFPAMVANHGSGGLYPRIINVAEEMNRRGYAAFLPVRRGYHDNPGDFWRDRITAAEGSDAYGAQLAAELARENDDVLAALDWLAEQPRIDAARIGVTGVSFGGIMTLLAAARPSRFRVAVNFAAAAMSWEANPALRDALLDAVRRITMPTFMIQAANDYSLAPTYALGTELARCGTPHETRIYAPNGATHADGHSLFTTGVATWSDDVFRFLDHWMPGAK